MYNEAKANATLLATIDLTFPTPCKAKGKVPTTVATEIALAWTLKTIALERTAMQPSLGSTIVRNEKRRVWGHAWSVARGGNGTKTNAAHR